MWDLLKIDRRPRVGSWEPERAHDGTGRDVAEGRQDHLLTVAEVADLLRVSNMTVYRLIKSGQLAAIRVGKNYRIRQNDLDSYLETGVVRADEAEGS